MLVTQEDAYYIPRLLDSFIAGRRQDFVGITILRGEIQSRNIRKYLDFMGRFDFTRYVMLYGMYKILDTIFPKGFRGSCHSVRGVAKKHGLHVFTPRSVNDAEYIEQVRQLGVDLIVSVAAPQIFRKTILSIPKYGCINIHNGLLPKYQGVLPSFWVLANGEEWTGTTVHYMNEKIDAGELILQEKTRVSADDTLHSLVYRTKITIGPRLLDRAVAMIERGEIEKIPVDWSQATYYSFPDADAVRRFRAAKRRFR